jgi:autotransporter-associated beta strand protein
MSASFRRIVVACAALAIAQTAQGQLVLDWDPNAGTPGAQGGTGNWLTTITPWLTGGTNQSWVDGAEAIFGGTAGLVTLDSAATANRLTFNTAGYTLQGAGTLTLAGSAGIFVNAATATIALSMAGTNGLVVGSTGTLTLDAPQMYTGLGDFGSVKLGAAGSLNPASSLRVNVDFDMTDHLQSVDLLTGGGTILLGNGTLTVGSQGGSSTFTGTITGTGGLTKTGNGTFRLSSSPTPSSYTGPTTVNGGVLESAGGVPDQSIVTLANASGVEFRLVTSAEVIGGLAGGGSNGGFLNLNGRTLTVGNNTTDAVFTGGTTSSVLGGSLIKVGSNTQTVGQFNATGQVTVNGGTLRMNTSGSGAFNLILANAAGVVLDVNGGTIQPGNISGGGSLGGTV